MSFNVSLFNLFNVSFSIFLAIATSVIGTDYKHRYWFNNQTPDLRIEHRKPQGNTSSVTYATSPKTYLSFIYHQKVIQSHHQNIHKHTLFPIDIDIL